MNQQSPSRRPAYVLWLGPGRPPISVSTASYGQPVRIVRQTRRAS